MKPLLLIALFVISVRSGRADTTSNELPPDVVEAFRTPVAVILYSLEPWEQPADGDEKLHGFKVLGQTELNRKQAAVAFGEMRSAVAGWDGSIAMCFDPRQALRTTVGGHTYDLLLCCSCQQLHAYRDGGRIASLGVLGSPKILNGLLSAAGVRLSTTDSDEDKAARRQRAEASEARWLEAMPVSIRPLWAEVPKDGSPSSLKPLRAAVARELPGNRQRILALFAWFGSGDGPWSGYPAYESIAEELLLDYPTSDLVAAAQTGGLTEPQLEGAARLFGGWDFSQRRPGDLKKLPSELSKKLLNHSVKTTNADKLSRAKHAFALP